MGRYRPAADRYEKFPYRRVVHVFAGLRDEPIISTAIDADAVESGIDLWRISSQV